MYFRITSNRKLTCFDLRKYIAIARGALLGSLNLFLSFLHRVAAGRAVHRLRTHCWNVPGGPRVQFHIYLDHRQDCLPIIRSIPHRCTVVGEQNQHLLQVRAARFGCPRLQQKARYVDICGYGELDPRADMIYTYSWYDSIFFYHSQMILIGF